MSRLKTLNSVATYQWDSCLKWYQYYTTPKELGCASIQGCRRCPFTGADSNKKLKRLLETELNQK